MNKIKQSAMIQVFKAKSSYTSHRDIDPETQRGIDNSDYDDIPEMIDGVVIFEHGVYQPHQDEYGDRWICRKSGWCEHKATGLKVRYTSQASPDYYKVNGCGEIISQLEVKRAV